MSYELSVDRLYHAICHCITQDWALIYTTCHTYAMSLPNEPSIGKQSRICSTRIQVSDSHENAGTGPGAK